MMMRDYFNIVLFFCFIILVLGRAVMLRRKGIKALLFGAADKSDFWLVPMIAVIIYALLAAAFGLPFPAILLKPLAGNEIVRWVGTALCAASLLWFAFALKSFGDSFRVGIDETAPDKLVTAGMFAVSRNPIYVAFLSYFIGIMLSYFNITSIAAFALFFAAIHRQILREEKFLKKYYGREYEDYCKQTRRYL